MINNATIIAIGISDTNLPKRGGLNCTAAVGLGWKPGELQFPDACLSVVIIDTEGKRTLLDAVLLVVVKRWTKCGWKGENVG